MDAPLTLEQTAELIVGHVEVEQELFRLTGFWSTDGSAGAGSAGPAAHSQAHFAAESAHHGWRAEQWQTRVVRSVGPAKPSDSTRRVDPIVAAVAGLLEDDLDPRARLAVWGHVLAPSLAGRYLGHRRGLASAADGGLDRWLGICITDLQRGATEAVALAWSPEHSSEHSNSEYGSSVDAAADAVRSALERVAARRGN